ncbi:MAG: helix-turn-helix domain-containing protein [Acidimicrobiaceae bacterium]|nr:helix-turn-helix domain-containing protein [Acidimicrobiaceae bacterium]
MAGTATATPGVGPMVRDWRIRRRRSQLDLALEAGVSARHLSFVETGRSRPSPELLLMLAERLGVPLRERNSLLLAAGYAPRYHQTSLDDPAMSQVKTALVRMLDLHNPYPGLVIDRSWNVVLANEAGMQLAKLLPAELVGPPLNVFRAGLHPDGMARYTLNFPEWGAYLLGQLQRLRLSSADPEVAALAEEVSAYPNVAALEDRGSAADPASWLMVPWQLRLGEETVSLFTTLTTFGTPQDVTLAELAIELYYPADEDSARILGGSR